MLVMPASFVAWDTWSEVNENGQIRGQVFIIFLISCLSGFLRADVSAKKEKKKNPSAADLLFFSLSFHTPHPQISICPSTRSYPSAPAKSITQCY